MNHRPRREEKALWEACDKDMNKGRRAGALMQDDSVVEIRSPAHQVELAQSRKVKQFVWMDELPANKQPAEQDAKPEPSNHATLLSTNFCDSGAISCPAVFPDVLSREDRIELLKSGKLTGKEIEDVAVMLSGYKMTVME